MAADTRIDRVLGTTKHVVAKNSKEFGKEISKYIDSKDQRRGDSSKKSGSGDSSKKGSGDKGKAAPKTGNPLMDLIKKKATAQASVFQTGKDKNGGSAPNSNAGSSSGSAAPSAGAGALVLAGSNQNQPEVNHEELELWPLIRSVKVRCNSAALRTGECLLTLLVAPCISSFHV